MPNNNKALLLAEDEGGLRPIREQLQSRETPQRKEARSPKHTSSTPTQVGQPFYGLHHQYSSLYSSWTDLSAIVDRLTKGRHYEPLTSLDVDELYDAMNRRVFRVHGLPLSIASDRGKQMVSRLWTRVCQRWGINIKLPSAQHPETDGQTEIANKFLKGHLRNYVNYLQDNWLDYLPDAEFMANKPAPPDYFLEHMLERPRDSPLEGGSVRD